jgi:tellurite methyltransferase
MSSAQRKWDGIYRAKIASADLTIFEIEANQALISAEGLLPKKGHALDLAAGLGGDSRFLAERGLTVDAIDISTVAMDWVNNQSLQAKLPIQANAIDIQGDTLKSNRYDLVHFHHFLDRSLGEAITRSLKPGGLLIASTFLTPKHFTLEQRRDLPGPSSPGFRLKEGELLTLFPSLDIILSIETGAKPALDQGIAPYHGMIIARKP